MSTSERRMAYAVHTVIGPQLATIIHELSMMGMAAVVSHGPVSHTSDGGGDYNGSRPALHAADPPSPSQFGVQNIPGPSGIAVRKLRRPTPHSGFISALSDLNGAPWPFPGGYRPE